MVIWARRFCLTAALPLIGLLSGCVVGPNYAGPPVVVTGSLDRPFARGDAALASPPPARWWMALQDPALDRLVDRAFAASPNLEAARARLLQSRAGLKKSQADLLPNTQASALALASKGLTNAFGAGALGLGAGASSLSQNQNATLDFYNAGFDATWELDLFGGQRRAIEGAKAAAAAAAANLEDAEVSLAAEVAQAYVSLRDAQMRLALAKRSVGVETQMLSLARLRRAGGSASDLDVERLNTQLQTTRADAPPLTAVVEQQLDRLATLTGQAPGALDAELDAVGAAPTPPAVVAVGDPATLLRRRPDVRAAERAIAQKSALIGQRTADLFPKVELLGDVGFSSTAAANLFNGANFSYLAAPLLQWRPLDFGRTHALIDQAKAERDEALADYQRVVLSALDDAETALSRYGRQRQAVEGLLAVAASARRAAALTSLRVRGGTATTLDQLDAERQRLSAEANLIHARSELTQDFVSLQKSLGLGWSG